MMTALSSGVADTLRVDEGRAVGKWSTDIAAVAAVVERIGVHKIGVHGESCREKLA